MPIAKKDENRYIGCNIRRARLRAGMSEQVLTVAVSRRHHRLTQDSLKVLEAGSLSPFPHASVPNSASA